MINAEDVMKESEAKKALYQAFLALETEEECRRFLEDLCTPAELEAFYDRWRVAHLLVQGETYRGIAKQTGSSVTTIGRVARFLNNGNNGYMTIMKRLGVVK